MVGPLPGDAEQEPHQPAALTCSLLTFWAIAWGRGGGIGSFHAGHDCLFEVKESLGTRFGGWRSSGATDAAVGSLFITFLWHATTVQGGKGVCTLVVEGSPRCVITELPAPVVGLGGPARL